MHSRRKPRSNSFYGMAIAKKPLSVLDLQDQARRTGRSIRALARAIDQCMPLCARK